MIGELRRIITFNDLADKEAVVSCPSFFTESERKALLDAAKIADLKVYKLFSESSAVTLSYGLFRKNDLPEKDKEPRNVIFVDFGHSKLSSFVSSFTKEKCSVLL
jgi:molecular chaperone DnaK (HSP70)